MINSYMRVAASQYKKYNEVRDILAGKVKVQIASSPSSRRKRSSEEAAVAVVLTPSKRSKPIQTPSKVRTVDVVVERDDDGTFQTPSSRSLFSPAMPTSIGPTPQKNGRILGLFDLLEENTENAPPNGYTGGNGSKTQATPSKASAAKLELGRSPMTPSRRNMLNAFTTPKGRKEGGGNSNNPLGARTPSSVSKLHLSTPAFLRRAPLLPTVDEDGPHYKSPEPIMRLPRKPLGRSLSSVVASLRKLEEEKLDEELEALHEMENEDQNKMNTNTKTTSSNTAKPAAAAQKKSKDAAAGPEKILEPDSQTPQLLGGFDDEGLYDSPTEEATKGRDGQPLRVYKKKGQKRTTRRVNMRPTRAKRPENAAAVVEEENDDDASEVENGDNAIVPETQFDPNKPVEELPDVDANVDSGSEFNDDDNDNDTYTAEDGEEDDEKAPAKKKPKKSAAGTDKKGDKKKGEKGEKEGKVKKAARKVNELAHANFKRLKLRNTGSKGGPGFGSRFRRRR